jgi:hypothetical protein
MSRQKPAAVSSTIPLKDAIQTAPTIRQCSLAGISMQACEFSTFAIRTALKRSRTGSHRLCGRLSFPDQVAGHRASIEPPIRSLVSRALLRFLPTARTGVSCKFGPSVMATVFRSSAFQTLSKHATRTFSRARSSKSYEPEGRGFKPCRARQLRLNGLGDQGLTRFLSAALGTLRTFLRNKRRSKWPSTSSD